MLEIFFGTDTQAVRNAALARIEEKQSADPLLVIVRLEAERYEPGQLASVAGAVSLFGGGNLYLLDTPSLDPVFYEELVELAPVFATSPLTFLVIEKTLLAAEKKKFTSHATFTELKKVSSKEFAPFSLAEALASKDKRALWLNLQAARNDSMTAEESIGILWWQLKTLKLAMLTKSADEAGVKDYPYDKAKRALTAFKPGELDRLIYSLLLLYHDGHAGKRDIDLALEAWVLKG